jgi:hypothetical protein
MGPPTCSRPLVSTVKLVAARGDEVVQSQA